MRRPITQITGMMAVALALSACGPGGVDATQMPTPYPFITATPHVETTAPPQDTAPAEAPPETEATIAGQPAEQTTITPAPGSVIATATSRPGVGCRYEPLGLFATVYQSDPGLPLSLGCVTGQSSGERPRLWPVTIDFQSFERGYMMWVSNLGWIKGKAVFVLLDDQTLSRYEDKFDAAKDPSSGAMTPPAGLLEPTGALGKVWRDQPGISARIGFAHGAAAHVEAQMQMFEFGQMIDVPPTSQVIVLKQGQPGSWSLHSARSKNQ